MLLRINKKQATQNSRQILFQNIRTINSVLNISVPLASFLFLHQIYKSEYQRGHTIFSKSRNISFP